MFTILPLGNVIDIACDIVHQVGEEEINDDIRLNDNGTITETEAQTLESTMRRALADQMTAKSMISNATVKVDRTTNVRSTSEVDFAVTIYSRGYVLSEVVTVGFGNDAAAGG